MPGYGIAAAGEGLLPWSWADERLRASHDFWLATDAPYEPVVVEGTAEVGTDPAALREAANASMRLQPEKVIGLREKDFTTTPARWTFP
ncbi:hypothetical protein ACGFMK_42015 [Amycolatopsis sp. NPDC049252]|uniref:hypothetical protein n=1 Tax=Amycolatopsis sp. NPDC049252 TaxID=3363933 RepID=UPI003712D09E